MSKKILHVLYNDKFIVPFIDFIKKNDISGNHVFLYYGGSSAKRYPFSDDESVDVLYDEKGKLNKLKYSMKYFHSADKIILHGLFNSSLVRFLYLQPWLLKKCNWVIWGGDLYYHVLAEKNDNYILREKWRKRIISKMGGFITYIKGDYELAQTWYGAKGQYHECFMYPSNLYKEYDIVLKKHQTINIQVGNSANPTNNHLEIFEKLEKYKDEDIKIIVPLSYGGEVYAKEVIEQGRKIFGDKFEPLTEFMPFDQYLELLSEIDIAIFNHNRQQAMGNIITLLGLGKKVYMRNDITPWSFFKEHDIEIFDVFDIDLLKISKTVQTINMKNIKQLFSREVLIDGLKEVFE